MSIYRLKLKQFTAATTALTTLAALTGPAAANAVADAAAPNTVDEVVITAGRRAQSLDQLGSSVTIVSAETIEQQQLQTVDEALQRTPGVTIIRSGGIGQNTQVRM